VVGPDHPFKYLGVYFTLTLDWTKQLSCMRASVAAHVNALRSRMLTVEQLRHIIGAVVLPGITYAMQVVTIPDAQLAKWGSTLRGLACGPGRLSYSTANAVMYASRDAGGFGLPHLTDAYRGARLGAALSALLDTSSTAGALVRARWRRWQRERRAVTPGAPLSRSRLMFEDLDMMLRQRGMHLARLPDNATSLSCPQLDSAMSLCQKAALWQQAAPHCGALDVPSAAATTIKIPRVRLPFSDDEVAAWSTRQGSHYYFFTDGSRGEDMPAGWAVAQASSHATLTSADDRALFSNVCCGALGRIGDRPATINHAEGMALLAALRAAPADGSPVTVYSDSAVCVSRFKRLRWMSPGDWVRCPAASGCGGRR
jgi:hypothetical protein